MKEISGDKPLNVIGRFNYLVYNLMRGVLGYLCYVKTEYWHADQLEAGEGSPGRKYINQFLYNEIPKLIGREEKINVCDIGCGSGYFSDILANLRYEGCYTGIDIYRHKSFDKPQIGSFKSSFVKSKIEDFETDEKFDLILSNTALEHIENDALAVSKCEYFLKPKGIQIHIVPSFWSLFLYLWHGYRQYNPKRIKDLFGKKQHRVYRIGGFFSFFLHLFFITIPIFFFRSDASRKLPIYPKLLNICNKLDRALPILTCGYVVVLKYENIE